MMRVQSTGKPVVLVTGIAGLIGTRIMDAFSSNYRVVGLDVKRPKTNKTKADWVECDLTKDESTTRALATIRKKHGNHTAEAKERRNKTERKHGVS